jgi:hypothetical protein
MGCYDWMAKALLAALAGFPQRSSPKATESEIAWQNQTTGNEGSGLMFFTRKRT